VIVINRTGRPLLQDRLLRAAADGNIDRTALARGLRSAGISAPRPVVDGLTGLLGDHALRMTSEISHRDELAATGLPLLSLPPAPDGIGLGDVYELADLLTAQGVGVRTSGPAAHGTTS